MEYDINNIEILKIFREDTKRDGTRYTNKKGDPFTKVDIYIEKDTIDDYEFEGKMTYFDYFQNTKGWKAGDRISGKLIRSGQYWNFEMMSKKRQETEDVKNTLEDHESRIKKIEDALMNADVIQKPRDTTETQQSPVDTIDESFGSDEEIEELPF